MITLKVKSQKSNLHIQSVYIVEPKLAWNKCSSRFCILNINSGFRLSVSEVWCVPSRSALETQGFCGHTKSVRSTFARLALLWLPPDLLIETQLERLVLRCSGGHPVYTAEINMHKDIIPKTFWSPLKKLQKVVNRQWPLKKMESLAKLGLKHKSNKANAPLLLWMIN